MKITYGTKNVRLTNGTLKGDRSTHDYDSITGSHQNGNLLVIESGSDLEIDHMLFTEAAGFCVISRKGMDRRKENGCVNVAANNAESGGFSGDGVKVDKVNTCRTIKPLDVTGFDGEFEFGYIYGYQGYPSVFSRYYQAYFYDTKMTFLGMEKFAQYKKQSMPPTTQFIHLEFNQATVVEANRDHLIGTVSNLRAPVDVHFHDNRMYNNGSLGFAYCGGQRWIIENNLFEKNGGSAAPHYGMDFEDGWDLMQDVVVRKNTFKDNHYGLVGPLGEQAPARR
jgi:hypothetical protein